MAIKFLQSVDIEGSLECNSFTIGGTTSVAFTTADHSKLDGIDASANAYTLPAATSTILGGE